MRQPLVILLKLSKLRTVFARSARTTVTVAITRPVGGHEDQSPALIQRADGSYEAPLALPNGAWDATITSESTALGPFELIRRFWVWDAK